jgi:serine/threonine protein kinase
MTAFGASSPSCAFAPSPADDYNPVVSDSPFTGEVPALAGRYKLGRPLGEGGMAEVYQARDLNLQRDVAIKLLRRDYIHDTAFQARFQQEARAAANLLHPNIVTVYDFGHDQDRFFIVMEYVDGTDLKTLMRRRGRLTTDNAVKLMIQICSGVGYAHRAGLVHCDLKPHNLLVTPDERVKITDFGIARALAGIRPDEHHDVVWGSPLYFSPEQAAGSPPSPASDVYSLGVVFYEMLTGKTPFVADSGEQLTQMHMSTAPTPPRTLNPSIPSAIERIVLKVLSKEPAARYRTADQLGRVLETYQPGGDVSPAPIESQVEPVREPNSETVPFPQSTLPGVDWLAVFLGLVAFLMIGGLIPLWLYACLLYPSCPLTIP